MNRDHPDCERTRASSARKGARGRDPEQSVDLELARKEEGLAMLLVDVLVGDEGEIELLVEYVRDRSRLSTEECEKVERMIVSSPEYADQHRVLRAMVAEMPAEREAPSAVRLRSTRPG